MNNHFTPICHLAVCGCFIFGCDVAPEDNETGDPPLQYHGNEAPSPMSIGTVQAYSSPLGASINFMQALSAPLASSKLASQKQSFPVDDYIECDSGFIELVATDSGSDIEIDVDYIDCDLAGFTFNGHVKIVARSHQGDYYHEASYSVEELLISSDQARLNALGEIEITASTVPGEFPKRLFANFTLENLDTEESYFFKDVLWESQSLSGRLYHSEQGFLELSNNNLSSNGLRMTGANNSTLLIFIQDNSDLDYSQWTYVISIDSDGDSHYESTFVMEGDRLLPI